MATFVRVTLPLIRTAVLGGCVLVVLTVISEYGAFEILRFQTFTTEIFTEFQFDSQAAGALSVPLVLLGLLVLAVDGMIPRRSVAAHRAAPRRRPPGCAGALPACLGAGALVGARRRCPDRHARLLDGAEPAHHAPGGGDARRRDVDHARVQRRGAPRSPWSWPCRWR